MGLFGSLYLCLILTVNFKLFAKNEFIFLLAYVSLSSCAFAAISSAFAVFSSNVENFFSFTYLAKGAVYKHCASEREQCLKLKTQLILFAG